MSGSVGKSENSNQSNQQVWNQQAPYLTDLYGRGQDVANQGLPVADFNQNQNLGFGMATDYAGGNAQNIADQSYGAWQDSLTVDPAQNPYFQSAYDAAARPVTQSLNEDILPSIRTDATMAGQSGSTRQGIAEGIALRGAQDSLTDLSGTMAYDAYNQGVNTRMGALEMTPTIQQSGMYPSQIYQDIGGQQQAQTQRGLDSQTAGLQMYADLLGSPTTLSSSSGSSNQFNLGFGKGV